MNKKYAAAHSNVVVNPNCQLEQKKNKIKKWKLKVNFKIC